MNKKQCRFRIQDNYVDIHKTVQNAKNLESNHRDQSINRLDGLKLILDFQKIILVMVQNYVIETVNPIIQTRLFSTKTF